MDENRISGMARNVAGKVEEGLSAATTSSTLTAPEAKMMSIRLGPTYCEQCPIDMAQ